MDNMPRFGTEDRWTLQEVLRRLDRIERHLFGTESLPSLEDRIRANITAVAQRLEGEISWGWRVVALLQVVIAGVIALGIVFLKAAHV